MRVLLTTRGSSGHIGPLAPFGHACLRAGHEVLVTAQRQNAANVERAGLPFAPVGEPADEEWMPLMGNFAALTFEEANAQMIGEFFGRLDTTAALPGLRAVVEDWRPDVLVRENWEYASTLVAELHGLPLARVGLGLAAVEERSIRWAAGPLDGGRAELGLPPDPSGDRLRAQPYLTMLPAELEDPALPLPARVHRFRHADPVPAPLPDWWAGSDDPLVYVSFGSVTAGDHLPYYPGLYRAAIEALAPLPARILLTIGEPRDLAELGPLPGNVRAEHWVPQDAVLPHAAAVVCHGGHGSTIGALMHGVPLVVLPLFSVDQYVNAAAVARVGAGVALDEEGNRTSALAPPSAAALARLAGAVGEVLAEDGHRREAGRLAESMRALPPVDASVEVLAALAGH